MSQTRTGIFGFKLTLSLVLLACWPTFVWADEPVSGDSVIRGGSPDDEIVITTTSRLAGAIHSLTWHGREFIDSVDHGRQLQSASSFDNSREFGAETFNPTEAGSRDDADGPTSTSRLFELVTKPGELRTRNLMAFWLAPGEKSQGQLARNSERLSRHQLQKDLKIGHQLGPDVLDYRVTFKLPDGEPHRTAQFEALTGYMPPVFEKFFRFDRTQRRLVPLTDGPGEQADPIVFATADERHAMGIVAVTAPTKSQQGPNYGRWRFNSERVVKWNCVYRESGTVEAGERIFQMLVPIGTKDRVESIIDQVLSQTSP